MRRGFYRGGHSRGGMMYGGPPRGMSMGSGGMFHGPPRPAAPLASPAVCPPPFDLSLCEAIFPKVADFDDATLSQGLVLRNTELTPTPNEQTNVMNLMTKITIVVEKIIVSPDSFSAATIEEVKQVGSIKKNTMIAKRCVGDLTVVFKTLPTLESITALGNHIVAELKSGEPKEVFGAISKDFGCEIAATQAVVKLLITTIPANMGGLDPSIHISKKSAHINMAAIRHARYLDEQASHSTIKVLVRILKDIRNRFFHLQPLNVWMIELLSYYAVMNTPNHQPLPLNQAFRRSIQLLASGIFLPGSAGIMDPCEVSGVQIQSYMTYEEQDSVCNVGQTLLRVLANGGFKVLLGLERSTANVSTDMSVWNGVVISPQDRAFDSTMIEDSTFPSSISVN